MLTVPPLLLGLVAFAYPWPPAVATQLAAQPADALPLIFRDVTPQIDRPPRPGRDHRRGHVELFVVDPVGGDDVQLEYVHAPPAARHLGLRHLKLVMRVTIALLGVGAVAMALRVQSVQALWFFTSDLVFVLLFPQLVSALFDRRANLAGSVVAFTVSLVLRLGGGEPLFGLPPLIPYPEIAAHVLPIDAARWYDETGALLFPFKTLAAVTGLVLLPIVSRLTASWCPPRELRKMADADG